MKKIIVISVLAVCVIVIICEWFYSFEGALYNAGLYSPNNKTLFEAYDTHDELFRIVRVDTLGDKAALIHITRKAGLFWAVDSEEEENTYGVASIGWIESGGIRKYDISTENINNFGWHLFLCR